MFTDTFNMIFVPT